MDPITFVAITYFAVSGSSKSGLGDKLDSIVDKAIASSAERRAHPSKLRVGLMKFFLLDPSKYR